MTTPGDLFLRTATASDVPVLARLNRQLIVDQRHDSEADRAALERRMARWVDGVYAVGVVERAGGVIAYAVWRQDEDGVYLRQFLVDRRHRRAGMGRAAYRLLEQRWGPVPVKLDVLLHNERGIDFWHALGFRDYGIVMRRLPAADAPDGSRGVMSVGRADDLPVPHFP